MSQRRQPTARDLWIIGLGGAGGVLLNFSTPAGPYIAVAEPSHRTDALA
jgi:hypothetical protein